MLAKLSELYDKLCLKFAKKCVENDFTSYLFALNEAEGQAIRNQDKYRVQFANAGRLKNSAVPYLQRLLNANQK